MKQILAGIAIIMIGYMAAGAIDQHVEQSDDHTVRVAINK